MSFGNSFFDIIFVLLSYLFYQFKKCFNLIIRTCMLHYRTITICKYQLKCSIIHYHRPWNKDNSFPRKCIHSINYVIILLSRKYFRCICTFIQFRSIYEFFRIKNIGMSLLSHSRKLYSNNFLLVSHRKNTLLTRRLLNHTLKNPPP